MATKTAILAVKVVTDHKAAKQGLDDYGSGIDKLRGKLDQAALPAAAALAAITAVAKGAGEAASELQQATGAVESVFKQQSAQIEEYAESAAQSVGLAKSEYKQMAAVFGAQLKNMGVDTENLAGQTNELMELGADLAATFGGTTADAVGALSSLLRGERDPIERYGVSIKQAGINAELARLGLEDLTGEERTAAELQATLSLLTQQTADAHGQFARESDTAAGAQQRANAAWEDAQAQLGEALLPLMAEGADIAADLATWIGENSEVALFLAGTIGGLAAGILILNGAIRAYQTVQTIATAAQWAFNAAAAANPIGLIIIAVAALIAIIVLLVANWDEVSRVAGEVFDNIIGWVEDLIGWISEALEWVGKLFSGQLGAEWLQDAFGGEYSVNHHGDFDPDDLEGTGAWPTWPARLGSPSPAPAGDTYNVTINGALDPIGVADQVESIIDRQRRLTGRSSAAGRRR